MDFIWLVAAYDFFLIWVNHIILDVIGFLFSSFNFLIIKATSSLFLYVFAQFIPNKWYQSIRLNDVYNHKFDI